jgi:hypothetical protein
MCHKGAILSFGLALFLMQGASAQTPDHTGQVPTPVPLKELVKDVKRVSIFRVTNVEEKDYGSFKHFVVIYKKVRDLKGKHPEVVIKLSLLGVTKPEAILARAKPGDKMIFFSWGHKSVTYFGGLWCYNWDFGEAAPVWSTSDGMIDGEGFRRIYSGSPHTLQKRVRAIAKTLKREIQRRGNA